MRRPPSRISPGAGPRQLHEQLKAKFVTSGCGNGTVYCPLQNNTRGQMATFLVKALGLP